MKNQISIFSLALVLMFLLSACTSSANMPNYVSSCSQTTPAQDTLDTQNNSKSANSESTHMSAPSNTAGKELTYKGFTPSNIPGKIKNIYYGGGPNVLVTTSTNLYLYDLSQDAIVAETEVAPNERSYRDEHYKPIQNGFVGLLLERNRKGELPNVTCVFYDSQLNRIQEINMLDTLVGATNKDEWSVGIQDLIIDVSNDGSKIAVSSIASLYVYDIDTRTGCQVINESQGMMVDDICFVDNSLIAFGGSYLPEGAVESSYSYGTVNTDGRNLQIYTPQGFRAGELFGANDSLLLVGQDMRATSGQALIHAVGKEARTVKLTSPKEGDMLHTSEGGAYFATSVNGEKLTIRIYDIENINLVSETSIDADDILISRVPHVLIIDDLHTAIVIYGQHVDTQIKMIQF